MKINFKPFTELELAPFNTADITYKENSMSARDFKSIGFPSFKDRMMHRIFQGTLMIK